MVSSLTTFFRSRWLKLIIIGTCEPEEFKKALEKIGVTIPSPKDLMALFNYYDTDSSGALDYKEFTQAILCKDSGNMERKST
jgi:Ca2+-binding EF-hand superfamily protein